MGLAHGVRRPRYPCRQTSWTREYTAPDVSSYNVNSKWPVRRIGSLAEYDTVVANWTRTLFRGVNMPCEKLKPSLARICPTETCEGELLAIEQEAIRQFVHKAAPLLRPDIQKYLDSATHKWRSPLHSGAMFVGRHYGLPTRCLDWTRSPEIALLFACNGEAMNDAIVWHLNIDDLYDAATARWPEAFGKKEGVVNDIEQDFLDRRSKEWICYMEYHVSLARAQGQKAVVTMTGHLCDDHAHELARFGVSGCGRIRIPADAKKTILQDLELRGFSARVLGLDHDPVDVCVANIKGAIEAKLVPRAKECRFA